MNCRLLGGLAEILISFYRVIITIEGCVLMALAYSAKEALRQAEAEGLTLVRSESSSTGYKGVPRNHCRGKPYVAQVQRGGKNVHWATSRRPRKRR